MSTYCTTLYRFIQEWFYSSDRCEIAAIGSFNQFTFEEIQSKLNYTKVEVLSRQADCFLVQLDNKNTRLLLWYTYPDGAFKCIESEYWKDLKIGFNCPTIK